MENANVILQLVVTTGNVHVMTSGAVEDDVLGMLIDLDRDYVKQTHGETCLDKRNQYSPAIKHFPGTVDHSERKLNQLSRAQYGGRDCGSKHPDRAPQVPRT